MPAEPTVHAAAGPLPGPQGASGRSGLQAGCPRSPHGRGWAEGADVPGAVHRGPWRGMVYSEFKRKQDVD